MNELSQHQRAQNWEFSWKGQDYLLFDLENIMLPFSGFQNIYPYKTFSININLFIYALLRLRNPVFKEQ